MHSDKLNTTPKLLAVFLRQYFNDNRHREKMPTIGDYKQTPPTRYDEYTRFIFGIWIDYEAQPVHVADMIQVSMLQLSDNPNITEIKGKFKTLDHLPDVTKAAQAVLQELWGAILLTFGNRKNSQPVNNLIGEGYPLVAGILSHIDNDDILQKWRSQKDDKKRELEAMLSAWKGGDDQEQIAWNFNVERTTFPQRCKRLFGMSPTELLPIVTKIVT